MVVEKNILDYFEMEPFIDYLVYDFESAPGALDISLEEYIMFKDDFIMYRFLYRRYFINARRIIKYLFDTKLHKC